MQCWRFARFRPAHRFARVFSARSVGSVSRAKNAIFIYRARDDRYFALWSRVSGHWDGFHWIQHETLPRVALTASLDALGASRTLKRPQNSSRTTPKPDASKTRPSEGFAFAWNSRRPCTFSGCSQAWQASLVQHSHTQKTQETIKLDTTLPQSTNNDRDLSQTHQATVLQL